MNEPRYPNVTVELIGKDGNAFAIMGAVMKALRRAGVEDSIVSQYYEEATAGDYNALLATTMNWVEVE